jgi:hypothetical protein
MNKCYDRKYEDLEIIITKHINIFGKVHSCILVMFSKINIQNTKKISCLKIL